MPIARAALAVDVARLLHYAAGLLEPLERSHDPHLAEYDETTFLDSFWAGLDLGERAFRQLSGNG